MIPRCRLLLAAFLLASAALPATARAQGLIIDRRPHVPIARSFEVREVAIDARIREQVAEVQVSQTFHNPGSATLEAEYLFPLPDEGGIQNFVLMVDGRELPGEIMPKDEARRIYESIVRSKQDPALLEYMGRGLLKTRVFPIPAGADRKVTLRYTQLLKREGGTVEFAYPLTTQKYAGKPIGRLDLAVRIESKEPIKSVYCPSHDADIKRTDDHEARVELVERDRLPSADFRLVYTLAEGPLGATVVSYRPSSDEDGYFLLLASPDFQAEDRRPLPKTVILVLDRSGSMSGKKIDQAKGALRFVLDNLREDDTFNIVAYDDRVESFKPELLRYDKESRAEALRYVDNIRPGGTTNISEALREALRMVPDDDDRPGYVLFLTDGLPTAGETSELKIAEIAREANDSKARIFSFGVGFDVNARLLDRLGGEHGGTSVYVKPDDDIEAHVARFYAKLTSPALTDLALDFDGVDVNRVYPRDLPDLFEGGQLVVAGRYRDHGEAELTVSGKVGGERKRFRFPVDFAPAGSRSGSRYPYVETLWAIRRVGDLIDQIDLHGENSELTDELVELSKRHGILTPYTAFLADERVGLHARAQNRDRAAVELEALRETAGVSGVEQRAFKNQLQQAQGFGGRAGGMAGLGGQAGGMGGLGGQSARPAAAAREPGARQATSTPGAAQDRSQPGAPASVARSEAPEARYNDLMAQFRSTREAPAANATEVLGLDAQGRSVAVGTVRRVGQKTFFRKGDRWIDSTVTPEQAEKATRIVQFSDAYFDLARRQGAELNQYLTFEEPVTVELGGEIFLIDRAAAK